jgi:hypothetical protein
MGSHLRQGGDWIGVRQVNVTPEAILFHPLGDQKSGFSARGTALSLTMYVA